MDVRDSLIFGFPGASWEISFQEIQSDLSISIEPHLLFQTKPWLWRSEGQSFIYGTETFARIHHMQNSLAWVLRVLEVLGCFLKKKKSHLFVCLLPKRVDKYAVNQQAGIISDQLGPGLAACPLCKKALPIKISNVNNPHSLRRKSKKVQYQKQQRCAETGAGSGAFSLSFFPAFYLFIYLFLPPDSQRAQTHGFEKIPGAARWNYLTFIAPIFI